LICPTRSSELVPTPPCQIGRDVGIYMCKCNPIDKSRQIRYAEKKRSGNVYNKTNNHETQNAIAEAEADTITKCLLDTKNITWELFTAAFLESLVHHSGLTLQMTAVETDIICYIAMNKQVSSGLNL
jgi:hypothetical protein